MATGISEGASKKNLVVFLLGDVLGHSFFFEKHAMFLLQLVPIFLVKACFLFFHKCCVVSTTIKETGSDCLSG